MLHAAEVLHREADERDFCDSFDNIMVSVGLPPREENTRESEDDDVNGYDDDGTYYHRPYVRQALKVPRTEQAFEKWKRATARKLVEQARYYGIGDVDDVLYEAGFAELPVLRSVDVDVTVRTSVDVLAFPDEDVTDAVPDDEVQKVSREFWRRHRFDQRFPVESWTVVGDG